MTEQAGHQEIETGMRLTLDVWHPDCWVLETSRRTDVGLLSYGCYSDEHEMMTSIFTLYAECHATIESAVDVIQDAPAVSTVREMVRDHRGHVPKPGNATRELLIEHDGTTQISDAFTDRGFAPAAPVDTRANTEVWTVVTYEPRDRIHSLLDEVESEYDASVTVTSITQSPEAGRATPLPVSQLSSRQREIFELARRNGYYDHPRRVSARELADELGISTSTFHEHIRKAESKLFGNQ